MCSIHCHLHTGAVDSFVMDIPRWRAATTNVDSVFGSIPAEHGTVVDAKGRRQCCGPSV